jgi:hypothetical protein
MSALINHKKHLNEPVEEQDLEVDSQYEKLSISNKLDCQYEDLDVDIVDNTDYDKDDEPKKWSGDEKVEI